MHKHLLIFSKYLEATDRICTCSDLDLHLNILYVEDRFTSENVVYVEQNKNSLKKL